MRLSLIAAGLLLSVAFIGCSDNQDVITLFGPTSPILNVQINPEFIEPGDVTQVSVQVLNNGNPASGETVNFSGNGGQFLFINADGEEAFQTILSSVTDSQGIVQATFQVDADNDTGTATVTASAMGLTESREIRLLSP